MANTFVTPEQIARTALGLLTRQIVLPALVWRDFETEFSGKIGATVNVTVPAYLEGRDKDIDFDRASPIVVDEISERQFPVTLTKIPYSAVHVTDEDWDLRIADFGAQVLLPQVRAIAEKVEGYLATTMQTADYATELALNEADPYISLTAARKALNKANVPFADRFVAVGADVEEFILNADRFKPLDNPIGQGAFTDATLGRIAGFTVVSSNALDPGEAYAFHRSAYVLATRAPAAPQGATRSAGQSYGGIAATWTQDYDPDFLRDRSVVRAFSGTAAIVDNLSDGVVRAVKIAVGV